MTEPYAAGYPVAPNPVPAMPAVETQALTPEEQADVDALYEELKPMATAEARNYVLARTKAEWQEAMAAKIDADWPVAPPPDQGALASRRADETAYLRPADPPRDADPNFNPNLPPDRSPQLGYDPAVRQ